MTPASSVLLLTTLTGFGYGLLAWLGLFNAAGALPRGQWFGPVVIVVALGFASAGLMASTLHLGRPERAWRAFSQWRSSWLSREGVAAVLTYLPACGFAALWWFWGQDAAATRALGLVSAAFGLVTVGCTAMIYASLIPIRQWHNRHTVPDYLVFAIFSGAVLLAVMQAAWFGHSGTVALVACLAALLALVLKFAYWRFIDRQAPLTTLTSATGVRQAAKMHALDQPHFSQNYILREMGFQLARKHAAKLRKWTYVLAFIAPAIFCALAAMDVAPVVFGVLALVTTGAGLFLERWLFFAEATHTAAIYYGHTI
ncbi:MAG: dimethyl sulfoxide reductase anchor subunit [Hyphomicrobiales bacterium]|nr:dimethyl sulfoxide reductase anchor subunit [Hyphomicrobiales bacterium]MDE2115163.1 dimethyl sulfoxide reductase anchor subunit [Hyphomicrobiales bacterium]